MIDCVVVLTRLKHTLQSDLCRLREARGFCDANYANGSIRVIRVFQARGRPGDTAFPGRGHCL